jgi:two-component system, cell cycle sensor histidine kinase and response regulator CckA
VPDIIRVLYAEDSATDRDLTRQHVATHAPDIALRIVETGGACLQALAKDDYDVLLLDNQLPDTTATELLGKLAANDGHRRLAIVVVTAGGDEELVVRLLRLGAWDYVSKQGNYLTELPALLRHTVVEFARADARERVAHRPARRILYIERHRADIDLTVTHFKTHAPHLAVDAVGSSQEALERLGQAGIDLVLTDLRLPDMSALELLRQLRHRDIVMPVVIVTGRGDEAAALAALKLGAYDYIVKREDYLVQLPSAIDNAIDRFHLRVANERLQAELADRERTEAERAQLHEQLRQAQKIDALGRLAGGVAHDFNNVLTVIVGYTEMMKSDLREGDPLREQLDDMRNAADRAAELTNQLLAFGRKQLLQPRVLDLNTRISGSVSMLRRLLGEDIELVTVLEPRLRSVKADPSQMDQVVINLAVNARDAMPRGGRLTIETHNVTISEDDARQHVTFQPGAYVMLAISDTGHAIDPTILPQIFDPFFTTKAPGKGTGLGLSTVYGIVKQSGGWIWVYSEAGHGTTFKIYLPQVDGEAPAEATRAAAPVDHRGVETILVVEDDAAVRKLTCEALRKHGYDVLEATNGGEALLICERRPGAIHLIVTDIVMPYMSGPDLATRARELQPQARLLFTSGYTDDAVVRHGLLDRTVAFLQKPFAISALAQKVRQVLDS